MVRDISFLKKEATLFRDAIEEAIFFEEFCFSVLYKYPEGCCNLASSFLQKYFYEKGIITDLISGQHGSSLDGDTHVWLEYDGIIIDITGDQYKCSRCISYETPVYVGTMNDGFHNRFFNLHKDSYEINWKRRDHLHLMKLNKDYNSIILHI